MYATRQLAAVLFLLVWGGAWGSGAEAQSARLPKEVLPAVAQALAAGQPQDLIILLDDTAIESEAAALRGAAGASHDTLEILAMRAARYAALKQDVLFALPPGEFETLRDYSHLPMMFLRFHSSTALTRLLERSEVTAVYEDGRYQHFLSQSLPLINQPAVAAAGKIGTGTAVAVLDTGINYTLATFGTCTGGNIPGYCSDSNPPPAPAGCKVACVRDFTPTDDGALDDNGHGTNVSGIVLGVTPDTRIVGLDVFRTDGFAYDSDLTAAVNWTIANKAAYNIVSLNMSLGGGGYTAPCTGVGALATPLANAKSAGILSAVASGNDGCSNKISYPGCLPDAVSVGAVYDANVGSRTWNLSPPLPGCPSSCTDSSTYADLVTCFSNSASFLTMLGPGCIITAAGYSMCGTSQATPHIAGAAAVLRAPNAFPSDTVDQTTTRMTSTGVPVTDPKNGITKPRLDLLAASGGGGGGTFSISGTVTTSGGGGGDASLVILAAPISGVTMTLSGAASATTTTDSNGNFSFTVAKGSYTVTPSLSGYTFSPTSRSVTVNNANVTGQNFTGTVTGGGTFSISGTVTTSGGGGGDASLVVLAVPLAGVTMTLTGAASATTTTDSNGNYTFSGLANGNYTVTPSKSGYTFSPTSRNVTVSGANVTGQNFTATAAATYTISGTVTASGGGALSGVTMTLSGSASATTTTDSNGNYSFTVANGSYTVTPSLSGYTFSPTSRSVTVNNANVTGQNFTGTPTGGAPDLVVSALSNPPASAPRGGSVSVTETTANQGTAAAGASTTRYRLSLDSTIAPADPLLTGSRAVSSLAAGANSSGTTTVTIPASLTPGTYYLGACADDLGAVAESNETNNCRASTTTLQVTGGGGGDL